MNKWLYGFCAGILALFLLLHGLDWMARRGNALPPVPTPNAYEELLTVAGEIKLPDTDLADLSNAQVREIALSNADRVKRIHELLLLPGAVPLQVKRGWSDVHANDLKRLKRLVVVLGLAGRACSLERQTNGTVARHLDIVRLGQFLPRGGLLSDAVTGLAIETLGAATLRGGLPAMDAATCRECARQLEEAEQHREPPARTWETEKRWAAASFGVVGRVMRFALRRDDAKGFAEFTKRTNQVVRRTRRVMLAIAARGFELETGKRPEKPADLVPSFLAAVPIDPTTGTPLTDIPSDKDSGG